jgi:capsular polysaccharide biosynthesis protein
VNDPDKLTWPNANGAGDYLPELPWTYGEFTASEDSLAPGLTGELANLKFIAGALRRRARFWCILAAVGLIAGCGIYLKSPPGYQASTTVWLTTGPYENIDTAANNDQAMAQTRTVAGLAVQELGLSESAATFLTTYKVIPVTERVIDITASAHSADRALADAGAVATAFLKFRATELQAQQAAVLASLNLQTKQAEQRLSSINAQIKQLQGQATSLAQQSQLKSLLNQQVQEENIVYQAGQAAFNYQTSDGATTAAAVQGSYVLDPPVLLARSRFKPLVFDAGAGFVGGLLLGIVIVMVGALASNRLRRRDDIAQALGAPVRLSVRAAGRRRLARGGSGSRAADVGQIAAFLRRSMTENSGGPAGLAVVPVDDLGVPAAALVALAASWAKDGKQVVVADLCQGTPAARLLGTTEPGVHTVSVNDVRLVLAVPERDDRMQVGPLDRGQPAATRSAFSQLVTNACASANVLLTLVTVDPSLGADHLATWTTDAIAVVTAGRSSGEKIHGVAELIRLSGARLVSAVLVGADATDESVGVIPARETVLDR